MEYIFGAVLTIISCIIYAYNNYFRKEKKQKIAVGQRRLQEKDLSKWNPAPLVDSEEKKSVLVRRNPCHVVNSSVGRYVDIDGHHLLNFASHDYFGMIENETVKDRAKQAIYKYGVGSCGPRGFYGTVDVHLELEEYLAKFTKTECCILYSYGFSTIASAIAAYAKPYDVIFADEKVNFAIQRGIQAARSQVVYFKHNDTEDLERLLKEYDINYAKKKKSKNTPRKFLMVEGLYVNSGYICPLPELIRIRRQYKLRMFMDESVSFGVLGATGRGVVEHYDADVEDVDMIMATMEYALGSGGGFCVGSTFVVEHQRLSGSGYCFSASLPPFLAVAARTAIDLIEKNDYQLISTLRERCCAFSAAVESSRTIRRHFILEGDPLSPIKHLKLRAKLKNVDEEWNALFDIAEHCKSEGVLVTVASYLLDKEHAPPPPSIRLTVNVSTTESDISKLVIALEHSAKKLLS